MQLVEDNMLLEGWVSFGIIWFLAILGIFYKIFWWLQYPRLSIILYLILGWSILFFIEPVRHSLTTLSLLLIIAEGIIYTFGIYFFVNDRTHRYYHGIWHIFVILGTLCHWAAVFVMAWPWENGLWAN
jgi:hemolysin III